MSILVKNAEEVLKNIPKFKDEVSSSEGLQALLPFFRGWYAHKEKGGDWIFGPSKFIGYEGLKADEYLDTSRNRDGRKTENRLRGWFTEVDEPKLYDELSRALTTFLDRYDKTPNKKIRISVLDETRDYEFDGLSKTHSHSDIVNLILAVAKTLPSESLRDLKSRLSV